MKLFSARFFLPAAVLCSLLPLSPLRAQLVGGEAFLQGDYAEVGLNTCGSYGTYFNAPAGYHANGGVAGGFATTLGFVADPDKDGWTVGSPSLIGDYFLPGSPVAGWSVTVGGTTYNNDRGYGSASACSPGGFGGGGGITSMVGSVTSVVSTGTAMQGTWEGSGSGLDVKKTVTVKTDKAYFTTRVVLKNTSTSPMYDTYYGEYVDPDNDVPQGGSFVTVNTIVSQFGVSGATASLVTAVGSTTIPSYLGMGSKDCRSKVIRGNSFASLTPSNLSAESWYNLTGGVDAVQTGTITQDNYIGIVFWADTILAGDSATFTMAYILTGPDLDDALGETSPGFTALGGIYNDGDTVVLCPPNNDSITIALTNADSYEWEWFSSNASLDTNAGTVVTADIDSFLSVIYAVASGACGIDTVKITVLRPELFAAAAVVDDTVCDGDTVYFTNSTTGAGGGYVWDFGDGSPGSVSFTPTHVFPGPGTYTVTYVAADTTYCLVTDTVSLQVVVRPAGAFAAIDYANNDSGCAPYTVDFVNASLGGSSFIWTFGDASPNSTLNNPSHTYTVPGQYIVTLYAFDTTAQACSPADTVRDTVYIFNIEVPVITLSDTLVCNPDTITLFAGVTNPASTMSYLWTPASAVIGPNNAPSAVVDATIPRIISVTVNNGVTNICNVSATKGISLTLWDKPQLLTTDTLICPGDTAQLHVEGGVGDLLWIPSLYLSSDTARHPLSWPPAPLVYTLATEYRHCVDSQTAVVTTAPSGVIALPDTVTLHPGDTYQMDPGGNCLYFTWFPTLGLSSSNIANPVASPPVNTRYFVTGVTEYGCPAADTIDVYVDPEPTLGMPNAFTPGVPGSPNNLFMVARQGLAKLNYFRVYNRWGNIVFQTADIAEGWDGTFNGEAQPMGVYVYTVEAVTPTGRIWKKQGNVTLLR